MFILFKGQIMKNIFLTLINESNSVNVAWVIISVIFALNISTHQPVTKFEIDFSLANANYNLSKVLNNRFMISNIP